MGHSKESEEIVFPAVVVKSFFTYDLIVLNSSPLP